MPIYEYSCVMCGIDAELLINSPNEPQKQFCTQCGNEMVKKVSLPTIRFNGSGWTEKEST